jgi:hypothetical protein
MYAQLNLDPVEESGDGLIILFYSLWTLGDFHNPNWSFYLIVFEH